MTLLYQKKEEQINDINVGVYIRDKLLFNIQQIIVEWNIAFNLKIAFCFQERVSLFDPLIVSCR